MSNDKVLQAEISSFEKSRIDDSLRIERLQRLQHEAQTLNNNGVIGKWETTHRGFETIIFLKKIETKYQAIIHFKNSKEKPTKEWLRKINNKYFIIGTKVNEHYIINSNGNLEIHDNQGLFTIGHNVFPGQEKQEKSVFNISQSKGQDIFYISGNYSRSSPKTLEGTNNDFWIVYYTDINTTFRVSKKTMKILKAENGLTLNLQ